MGQMTTTKIISGMARHQYHDGLFTFCPDFEGRKTQIIKDKPENERKTGLKLFVMLTKEQTAMLPKEFVDACKAYSEAMQKYVEAMQKHEEAWQKYEEVKYECKLQLEKIHKKICDCKEWNGKELVFPK